MIKTNLPRKFQWRPEKGQLEAYGPGVVSIPDLMFENLKNSYNLVAIADVPTSDPLDKPLPVGFPKKVALEHAGLTTLRAVLEYPDLTSIAGIGVSTNAEIIEMANYYVSTT